MKRLKKEILGFLLALILVPWVFVTVFGIRNNKLKKENAEKTDLLNQYLEQMEMLSQAATENEDLYKESLATMENMKPVLDVESMTKEEIEALSLSEEELYDGYRKVYLTFDDGPSSNTEAILDILKEYNVKATFFVIYKDGRDNEELYRRIADEGHTLGMHSCTHVYSTVYGSEEDFIEDTNTLRNFLYMVTGVESEFYRFPGGSSNRVATRDEMRSFAQILNDEGIIYYDWNVSSQDATSSILSKNQIVRNATDNLERFNEAVILFHDTGSKVTTVEALPEIIEKIQAMDHTVILPITRETKPIQHLTVGK
ncbi:MAG: polysaccharide deacetylase [Lachnospiraceae bacterium]|nr:polysaccharide deacetylase [Lachnospiraceae bacterium]